MLKYHAKKTILGFSGSVIKSSLMKKNVQQPVTKLFYSTTLTGVSKK